MFFSVKNCLFSAISVISVVNNTCPAVISVASYSASTNGCSKASATQRRKRAASAPSITR